MSGPNATSKVLLFTPLLCEWNFTSGLFFAELLKTSPYGNEEDIKSMLDYFDQATKPVFKDEKDSCYTKFGSMGCNDPNVKIRRGTLTLSG